MSKLSNKKIFVSNCFVEKGITDSDMDLIYMKKVALCNAKNNSIFFQSWNQGIGCYCRF